MTVAPYAFEPTAERKPEPPTLAIVSVSCPDCDVRWHVEFTAGDPRGERFLAHAMAWWDLHHGARCGGAR